jgi:ubiquinone/menaquinone biosynthesis C-methylase UbiE
VSNANKDDIRGDSKARKILQLLPTTTPYPSSSRYLDVGAANGAITKKVGAKLGFKGVNVHGVDIPEWLEHDHAKEGAAKSSDGLATMIYLERKKTNQEESSSSSSSSTTEPTRLPYDDASFDLVTCLMSIHHFEDRAGMLHEIARVMKPGAKLVLREHNRETDFEDFLIRLEHAVYVIAIDGGDAKTFWGSFICALQSAAELRRDLEHKYGFKGLYYEPEEKAANKAYWAVFEKL